MTLKGQARNAYPAMRVFVFGQEVTDDVLQCTCNWADDTRAPSTAQFTLANKPSGTGGAVSRYVVEREDILRLFPNDLDPVTVKLPDLKATLENDPAALGFQQEFLAAAFDLAGGQTSLSSQAATVLERFGEQIYVPRLAEAQDALSSQVRERLGSIPDHVKRRVLLAKFDKTQRIEQPDIYETGEKQISDVRRAVYLKGAAFRYPVWANHPIFHSNDPVRIFWRDPFNGRAWYHMFSGFISDWTVSAQPNGEKLVTFVCEDVLRLLRYARISTNPGIFDIRALKQVEDFVTQTFFNDDFTKITLTELLYTLIFGPEIPGTTEVLAKQGNLDATTVRRIKAADDLEYFRYAANGESTTQRIPAFGIGAFNFERSITCILGPTTTSPQTADNDPEAPVRILKREVRLTGANALGVYQSIVDHMVKVSDLETLLLQGETPTSRSALQPFDANTGEPTIEAVISEIGENPHRYPVDAGRLIVLAPASIGANVNRSILEKDFRGPEVQSTFKTRLFVILNVLQRIEFSFYATPRGDIVCEMPLYDFDPADFGEEAITYGGALDALAETPASSGARTRVLEAASRGTSGPYAPHYRVALRDTISPSQTFSDEKVRTQFRTDWSVIQGLRATGMSSAIGLPPEVVTLRGLVPQFGVRLEQADPPAYIASKEAAQVYCQLKINQTNAEALTSNVEMIPQLRIGPNRPLEFADGTYVATLRSVGRTLNWEGRDMGQSIGVNYTRVWDGLVDASDNPIYTPIGGAASRPMNYAALFRLRVPPASSMEHGSAGGLVEGDVVT